MSWRRRWGPEARRVLEKTQKRNSVIAATPRKNNPETKQNGTFPTETHSKQRLKAQGITLQYKFAFKEENSLEALVRT